MFSEMHSVRFSDVHSAGLITLLIQIPLSPMSLPNDETVTLPSHVTTVVDRLRIHFLTNFLMKFSDSLGGSLSLDPANEGT